MCITERGVVIQTSPKLACFCRHSPMAIKTRFSFPVPRAGGVSNVFGRRPRVAGWTVRCIDSSGEGASNSGTQAADCNYTRLAHA